MNCEISDIVLAMKRDKEAFARIYRSIYKDLYKLAYYNLSDSHNAEDAVSEAIADAWKGIDGLKDENKFSGWMIKILIRKCSGILRERYKQAELFESGDADMSENERQDVNSLKAFEASESRSDIMKAMAGLSDGERLIISLCVVSGYTSREAGEILELNSATVRSKLNRALAKVREKMN